MLKLLKLHQNISKKGTTFLGERFKKSLKKSLRNDFTQSFFNGTLALLCVLLAVLSASPSEAQAQTQKTTANIQSLKPMKAEAAEKPQVTNNIIVDKLTEEASKESVTSYDEIKQNVTNIVESLNEKGIATPRVIAYAMATAERETGNTFKPIEEYGGPQQAIALGYSGGEKYYGRGYIQITHDYNYAKFGERIGLGDQLVNNPELALDPAVASDIMAEFFKETGVAATAEADFVAARGPVNGTDHAEMIAADAEKYLETIQQANGNIADNRDLQVK